MLSAAICFFALVTCALEPRSRSPLVAYVVASVLGFYTIPSFLYPFVSITVLAAAYGLWTKQWPLVRAVLAAGGIIAAVVPLLYGPVLLISGVRAVTSNADVQRLAFGTVASRLPAHLSATADWLCGVNRGGLVIVLAIAAVGGYHALRAGYKIERSAALQGCPAAVGRPEGLRCERQPLVSPGDKRLLVGSMLGVLLMPPAIALAHGVIPYERTWIYVLVPLYVLGAAIVDRALSRVRFAGGWTWALPAVVVIVAVVGAGPFRQRYDRDYSRDLEADRLFAGFPSSGVATIAYDDVYFADLLTYRVQLQRRDPVVAARWTPGAPLDADAVVVSRHFGTACREPRRLLALARQRDGSGLPSGPAGAALEPFSVHA